MKLVFVVLERANQLLPQNILGVLEYTLFVKV